MMIRSVFRFDTTEVYVLDYRYYVLHDHGNTIKQKQGLPSLATADHFFTHTIYTSSSASATSSSLTSLTSDCSLLLTLPTL